MPEPPIFTPTKSVEVELERTDDGFKINKVNKVVQQEYTPVTLSMLRDFERHGIDLTKIQFFLSSGITLLSEKKQTNYELTPAGNVKMLRLEQKNEVNFNKYTKGRLLSLDDIHKVDGCYVIGISFDPGDKNILYFSQYEENMNLEYDYFYIQPVDYASAIAGAAGKYSSRIRVHYGDKEYFIDVFNGIPYLMIKYDVVLKYTGEKSKAKGSGFDRSDEEPDDHSRQPIALQ